MKNEYFKNLEKIEFVITDACTGSCRHCSQGGHKKGGARLDPKICVQVVKRVSEQYDIRTVMTFGGEPLLHTEAVYAVMSAALGMNVPKRQLITNGYFSHDAEKVAEVAEKLARCGVNDLLLSVDAFHQETIPVDAVRNFAREVVRCEIPIRLQPAWLVSREDDNSYNAKTRQILESLGDLKIPVGEGNIIFPEGNAAKYLSEYFKDTVPENPYIEDPEDIRCLSVSANGDLDGNIYNRDIMEILENYTP